MFLDSWLGLAIWGTVFFGVLLVSVVLSIAGLVYAAKLRREGRGVTFWLIASPLSALLVALCAGVIYIFFDHRIDRHVVLDLGKPRQEILAELIKNCTSSIEDDHCDTKRYNLMVTIIFQDGLTLEVVPKSVHWPSISNQAFGRVSLMGATAMSLQSGRNLMLEHASKFSVNADPKTKKRIAEVESWLTVPNNNAVYSESWGVEVRPGLDLEFRKNVDRVSIDYSIELR